MKNIGNSIPTRRKEYIFPEDNLVIGHTAAYRRMPPTENGVSTVPERRPGPKLTLD